MSVWIDTYSKLIKRPFQAAIVGSIPTLLFNMPPVAQLDRARKITCLGKDVNSNFTYGLLNPRSQVRALPGGFYEERVPYLIKRRMQQIKKIKR
jgi:hypothetical protein